MRYSANIERLQPSATIAVSTLAKKLAGEGRDILNLSAGEPDFDTPVFIADAAVAGIRDGQTRYTPPAGIPALRKAIAARLTERAGRPMDWAGVVVTAGAKQSLFNATFCLFGPGDEVMVAAPYWTSYPDLVTIARADAVEKIRAVRPRAGATDLVGALAAAASELAQAGPSATRRLVVISDIDDTAGRSADLTALRLDSADVLVHVQESADPALGQQRRAAFTSLIMGAGARSIQFVPLSPTH